MARTNMQAIRVKPASNELLTLRVLRREQISPHFARVSLGAGDINKFAPMGYDQWFRLFLPVPGGSLDRAPKKLDTLSFLKFLAVSKQSRPVMRNYTVRSYRPDGPQGAELDVDVVLHGSPDDGTAGPASAWAQTCAPGDLVGILDEGIGFNPPTGTQNLLLVGDETALPAIAGILAALPADARGQVIVEIPSDADRQGLSAPSEMTVTWLPRAGHRDGPAPGALALRQTTSQPMPAEPTFGWVAGEQGLASGVRRHWVAAGLAKNNIMFCGYWRSSH